MSENKSKLLLVLQGFKNIVGVGMYLLLMGTFLEGLTLIIQKGISFPVSLTFETQTIFTVPINHLT